jgi:hypothetical protein
VHSYIMTLTMRFATTSQTHTGDQGGSRNEDVCSKEGASAANTHGLRQ